MEGDNKWEIESLSFDKLNNRNWSVWSVLMEAYLRRLGDWGDMVFAADPAMLKADIAGNHALRMKDMNVRRLILMMVADHRARLTTGCMTAHEIWTTLAVLYQPTGRTWEMNTKRRLLRIQQQPHESQAAYALRGIAFRDQLTAAGCGVDFLTFVLASMLGLRWVD